MSEDERKLYEVLFPNDNNPNYINYAYFKGGSSRSLEKLRSKVMESNIDSIVVEENF